MLRELSIAIKYWDVYYFLALHDVKSRFRRSRLGILWIVIQQLAYAAGAGFIWSNVFGVNASEFIPFLTVGVAIWSFIAASMIDGSTTFVLAHGYLKQLPLPQSLFIFRTVLTQGLYLFIGLSTAVIVLIFFDKFSLLGTIYSIPGVCILLIYFYGASGALAYLGIRYRDLQHALTSIFSMLFLLTPVMYPPEVLIKKGIAIVVYGNPFASLIEIVRHPLIHHQFADYLHYVSATLFTIVMIIIRFYAAKKWERFVPFWS
ncbi:MAG: ABC transporter permease [Pseudomonadota bacterium]